MLVSSGRCHKCLLSTHCPARGYLSYSIHCWHVPKEQPGAISRQPETSSGRAFPRLAGDVLAPVGANRQEQGSGPCGGAACV